MAVTIDNVANSGAKANQTSYNFPIVISALANFLIVIEQCNKTNVASSVSGAGGSLTSKGSSVQSAGGNAAALSLWGLPLPNSGSQTITINTTASSNQVAGAISLIGVNLSSPFGTLATASQEFTSTPAVTATGAGSNDLYIGGCSAFAQTSLAPGGTGQVEQWMVNAGGNYSFAGDTISGSNAGAFSWTETGAQDGWASLAIAVFGAVAAPQPYLPNRRSVLYFI